MGRRRIALSRGPLFRTGAPAILPSGSIGGRRRVSLQFGGSPLAPTIGECLVPSHFLPLFTKILPVTPRFSFCLRPAFPRCSNNSSISSDHFTSQPRLSLQRVGAFTGNCWPAITAI